MIRPLFLFLFAISSAQAAIDDLIISEVVPSTGEIEVTNTGEEAFTTSAALTFCHRFNYGTTIPANTEFAAGESKVFTTSFSNVGHSDLWLYRVRSFGNAANIITGLNWGGSAGVGRTALASSADLWDGVDSTASAPPEGMALLLTGEPGTAAGWTVGDPDLGNFVAPVIVEPLEVTIDAGADSAVIRWTGSVPPFQVESSSDLTDWSPHGDQTDENELTLTETDGNQFYRVRGDAPAASATYQMTFTSTWSREVFSLVPGNDHFSPAVGVTHTETTVFWEPGGIATDGIRQMAETGGTSSLLSEIDDAVSNGGADVLATARGIGTEGDSTTINFTANRSHPFFTLVSMIAPSPDWFVGVHGEGLLDSEGRWIETATYDLLAYDAGTDSGSDFTSSNDTTNPREPILQIGTTAPFAVSAGFLAPQPLAQLVIERIAEP